MTSQKMAPRACCGTGRIESLAAMHNMTGRRRRSGRTAGPDGSTQMTGQSEPAQSASARTASAAVIGGGPAGLVAALALAHFGVPAVLVAPSPSLPSPARGGGKGGGGCDQHGGYAGMGQRQRRHEAGGAAADDGGGGGLSGCPCRRGSAGFGRVGHRFDLPWGRRSRSLKKDGAKSCCVPLSARPVSAQPLPQDAWQA